MATLVTALVIAAGCSRSALDRTRRGEDGGGNAESCPPGCRCDALTPSPCDDLDPCTDDSCAEDGGCRHAPSTQDLDGDGHRAISTGKVAGEPEACGDDCDDRSADSFAGHPEVCDGRDNDCNGVIDDGFGYTPDGARQAVRVSSEALFAAQPSGLACDGRNYLAEYEGVASGSDHVFTALLSTESQIIGAEKRVSSEAANAHGGTVHGRQVVWNGERFGLTWNDTRDQNYEIYFAALDGERRKVAPGDVRITRTPDFSFNPTIAWTGTEFVVVWEEGFSLRRQVLAQRVGPTGNLLGPNVQITDGSGDSDLPFLAVGPHGIGVVAHDAATDGIEFFALDFDLEKQSARVELGRGISRGTAPRIAHSATGYIVAWHDLSGQNAAIWATMVSERGAVLVPAKQVTGGSAHARFPDLLPLGDRVLLAWSDDRDRNQGYEIYVKTLSAELDASAPERRVTTAVGDSIFPMLAFGPAGDVGVLFRDDRLQAEQVWFTTLGCRKP